MHAAARQPRAADASAAASAVGREGAPFARAERVLQELPAELKRHVLHFANDHAGERPLLVRAHGLALELLVPPGESAARSFAPLLRELAKLAESAPTGGEPSVSLSLRRPLELREMLAMLPAKRFVVQLLRGGGTGYSLHVWRRVARLVVSAEGVEGEGAERRAGRYRAVAECLREEAPCAAVPPLDEQLVVHGTCADFAGADSERPYLEARCSAHGQAKLVPAHLSVPRPSQQQLLCLLSSFRGEVRVEVVWSPAADPWPIGAREALAVRVLRLASETRERRVTVLALRFSAQLDESSEEAWAALLAGAARRFAGVAFDSVVVRQRGGVRMAGGGELRPDEDAELLSDHWLRLSARDWGGLSLWATPLFDQGAALFRFRRVR